MNGDPFSMSDRVVVLGGKGYVGEVLCPYLRGAGYVVRVIDRALFSRGEIADDLAGPYIQLDIRDPEVYQLFFGFSSVINLAGISNDPTADPYPELTYRLNVEAAVDCLRQAHKKGVRRYVYASSASVYDRSPSAENATEDSTLATGLPTYTDSKIKAEKALAEAAEDVGMDLVILRKGTIYGWSPRMRFDLIVNSMLGAAKYEGVIRCAMSNTLSPVRPLVEVRDVAKAYKLALRLPYSPGETRIYNICASNWSTSEVAHYVRKAAYRVGISADIKDQFVSNPRSYAMSSHKAEVEMKFSADYILSKDPDLASWLSRMNEEIYWSDKTMNVQWMEEFKQVERQILDSGPFYNWIEG